MNHVNEKLYSKKKIINNYKIIKLLQQSIKKEYTISRLI